MRFEHAGQFWEIELGDRAFVTRAGQIGTRGTATSHAFATIELARREHDRAIVERLQEGYRAAKQTPIAIPSLANAELEAAIREQPDEPGPYLVYADWLQQQGSPLGELVVLMHEQEATGAPEVRKRIDAIVSRLGLPLPDRASFGWRWGFWSWVRIHNALESRTRESFDTVALARSLFASPLCRMLEELRIGMLSWDESENYDHIRTVLEEAVRHRWAGTLHKLHLGDIDGDSPYAPGDVSALVSRGFPGLRALRIVTDDRLLDPEFVREGFELPQLVELAIEGMLLGDHIGTVLASKVPMLEALELWVGPVDPRDYRPLRALAIAGLDRLLSGDAHPRIRRLGLRNAANTDDLADLIARSPIAARLDALDLSLGTLTDAAASRLAGNAPRFPRLIRLDVDDNYLTRDGLQGLANAFPRACVISRRQKREEPAGTRWTSRHINPTYINRAPVEE